MRIKHYGIFKNEMETLNWENLRNDDSESPYYLPKNVEDYLIKVDIKEPSDITKIILKEIEIIGLKKVFSLGSGIAFQEYQLKKFSDLSIVITEFNSSILRLKEFEVFDDALMLDAFNDSFPVDESWIVLFPRIDTEFDDHQLSELFAKCHKLGIVHICFIPAELLSFHIIMSEIKTFIISIIKRKRRVFCGYARSIGRFQKIWSPYYILSKKYEKVFFLKSK